MTKRRSTELPRAHRIDLTIDEENLVQEYLQFPADYATWLWKVAVLGEKVTRLKALKSEAEANAHQEAAIHVTRSDGKRPTVADIAAAVAVDEGVKEADRRLARSALELAKAKAISEALRAKKDMLVSLGAHKRAELAALQNHMGG